MSGSVAIASTFPANVRFEFTTSAALASFWTGEAPVKPYVSPDVWRMRSWIVIGRLSGSRSSLPPFSTPTFRFAKAGIKFETGSAMASRPSSTSIIAATETIGFVIE